MSRILRIAAAVVLAAGMCQLAVIADGPAQDAGFVTEFKDRLATVLARAGTLVDAINAVPVKLDYCDAADRAKDGRDLSNLQATHAQILREYNELKGFVQNLASRPGPLSQFLKAGFDVSASQFWNQWDGEIVIHPRNDLAAKQKIFAQSKVIDCSKRAQPAAPPKPPAPPANPLAGLKRPGVPTVDVPAAPRLCTEDDRRKWEDATIKPRLKTLTDAAFALGSYQADVFYKLQSARDARPPDAAAVKALQSELDWGLTAHAGVDALFNAVRKIRDSATVVDCNQPATPPQQPADKGSTDKQVGARPRGVFRNPLTLTALGAAATATALLFLAGDDAENPGQTILPTDYNGTYTGQAMPTGLNTCGFTATSINGVLNVNASGIGTWRKTHLSVGITFDFDVSLVMNASGATFSATKMQTFGGLPFRITDNATLSRASLVLRQRFEGLVNNVVVCETEMTMTLTRG